MKDPALEFFDFFHNFIFLLLEMILSTKKNCPRKILLFDPRIAHCYYYMLYIKFGAIISIIPKIQGLHPLNQMAPKNSSGLYRGQKVESSGDSF